jgi:Predicted metal-binding integral membrane protein
MDCSVELASKKRSSWFIWLILWIIALFAWLLTVQQSVRMPVMPGTMGMSLPAFLGFWTVMMVAMMLPAFAPVLSLHLLPLRRPASPLLLMVRITLVLIGYLCIWMAFGLPVFCLAHLSAFLIYRVPEGALYFGMVLLFGAGVSQLTPLASYCLTCCNTGLMDHSHTAHVPANMCKTDQRERSPIYDLACGLRYGLYCLGCCGGLMLVLVPFGLMNLPWMAAITLIVFVEKVWQHGKIVSYLVGYALIFLCLLVWIIPSLVPDLHLG